MINKVKYLSKSIKILILFIILISGVYLTSYVLGYTAADEGGHALVFEMALNADNYNAPSKTFFDHSGHSHHGISANNAVFSVDQYGKSEGAAKFNGSTDHILISNGSILTNPTAVTIAAWIRKDGNGHTYECAFHQGTNNTIGASSLWLGVDNNDYFTATIGANTGVGWAAGRLTEKPVIGEWNHLLATWDGSVVRVYLNGEYKKQYALSSYNNISNPIRIGASASNNYQYNGAVKDVLIYARSFSAEEVRKLYEDSQPAMQVSSIEKGLIGHWSLDGTHYNETTNRVTDSSAYANHATNYGAVLASDRYGRSNGAMSINGANSRIAISYQNPIYQTSVTAWFKSNGAPIGGYHIITGGASVEISINSSGYIRTGVVTNTQGRKVFNSGGGLTDGNWHQVAFTYDGVNLKSFIDGELTATNPVSGTLTGTAQEIGRYLSNSYIANGVIDDVRIYNRAISEEEIRLLYDSNSAETVSGSLQKGLVLDIPLTAKYTKGGSSGAEIMTDTTPYSNDAENHGANISLDGAQFDGISDYIVSENNIGSASSSPRTISVWFYPQAQRTQNLLGYGAEGTGRLFDVYLSANGQIAGHFYSGGYDTLGSDSPIYSLNEWQHFAISYDGTKAYIYYNGEYYKEKELALNTGTSKLFIGKGVWGSPAQFYGKISNVKIYNRALNNTEIETLYDYGSSGAAAILGGA